VSRAEFVLNGNLKELGQLADQVSRFVRECSLEDQVEFDLNLVLEELFVNALRHGGCEGMENAIRVQLQSTEDGVEVKYSDRGIPFDPTTAAPPDLETSLEDRRAGGLGIHFVRELMSGLRYQRCGDENWLTMTRVKK
jgi:anti-sigma regulatory factor (Ser/Thr protein kinase)